MRYPMGMSPSSRSQFIAEMRHVFKLALPITFVQLSYHSIGFVDTVLAGRSDPLTLGAVGLGNIIFFSVAVFGIGLMLGMDAIVARAMGTGDHARAMGMAAQSFYLGIFAGIGTTVFLLLVMALFPLFGVVPELIPGTRVYIASRLVGIIPMFWSVSLRSYLQGREITTPVIHAAIAVNVFNFVADWVLLFGDEGLREWGLPGIGLQGMGPAGLGWASSASSIFLAAWLLHGTVRHAPREHLSLRWQPKLLRELWWQGLPVGIQLCGEVSFFALMGLMVSHMGVMEAGAHAAAANVGGLSFALAVGAGSAGAIRVGNAMGRGRLDLARAAGVSAMLLGCSAMFVVAIFMWVMPHRVAGWIVADPQVIKLTAHLLIISGFFQVFDGMQGVLAGVLRGMGQTKAALVRYICGLWGVGFPLAWLFGIVLDGGAMGVWLGITAGLVAAAVLLCQRFLLLTQKSH